MKYKLIMLSGTMSFRKDHTTLASRLYVVSDDSEIYGDEIWSAYDDGLYRRIGDSWLHVTDIDGKAVNGWIALTHMGKLYCEAQDVESTPPPPPPPAGNGLDITAIMRQAVQNGGGIASLLHDFDNPLWGYKARKTSKQKNYPETVPLNNRPRGGKGDNPILTDWMDKYLQKINTPQAYELLHVGNTGWFNSSKNPQAVNFGGNSVLVTGFDGKYAKVWAVDPQSKDLDATWFTPNGRLAIMKFTVITQTGKITKPGKAVDAYMPFLCNGYFIPIAQIEMWARLPFVTASGAKIVEYLTMGDDVLGLTPDNDRVLLYTPKRGFVTNWRLKTIPPPPHG